MSEDSGASEAADVPLVFRHDEPKIEDGGHGGHRGFKDIGIFVFLKIAADDYEFINPSRNCHPSGRRVALRLSNPIAAWGICFFVYARKKQIPRAARTTAG